MKELLKYLVIRCTTTHAKTAIEIYNKLYSKEKEILVIENHIITQKEGVTINKSENKINVSSIPVNSKKDEILESLQYLKSKKFKTNQDKESIYSLEMVLKNLK
jgi:hypothetical protein